MALDVGWKKLGVKHFRKFVKHNKFGEREVRARDTQKLPKMQTPNFYLVNTA